MPESKSASVVFTNSGLLAKNAQVTADSAKTAAEVAQNQAITAQRTADGKNSIYRGPDPATVPTAGLKKGDLYFTDNALYTWTGTSWEKTVSDTTGAEIHAKVEAAMQESQKSVADLKAEVKSKVSEIDSNLSATTSDIKNSLSSVRNDLLATKTNLENTKTSLSTTVADLQKQTGQLSGSLETANSKIEYNSQAIAEVKHTAEEISTTVSNLHSGDRNYARNTFNEWQTLTGFTGAINYSTPSLGTFVLDDLKAGDTVTIGYTIKNSGIQSGSFHIQSPGDSTGWSAGSIYGTWYDISKVCPDGTTTTITEHLKLNADNLKNSKFDFYIRTDNFPAGTLFYKGLFVKKGTMATDWTPAPEDTDQSISKVSQTADAIRADLTNTKGDVASIKQTADSLTTRMANAEGNVSSLQQTAQGLTTRVTNTESNVSTLQQTASKLQSDLTNAKGDISSVKQTAEEVRTTVSNIRVGGRNLVLGTQEAKTIFDGTGYTNRRDITFELGYYWSDLQRVDLKKHLSNLGLTYDDTLTVTGNLTISKNGTLAKSDFANDFQVGLFRTTHNWAVHATISKGELVDGQTTYKVKETFVIGDAWTSNGQENPGWTSPSPYCWLNMAPSGYSISVDHYKVEKGTMATDWTPAPEDTDQSISKVSQTADAIRADLTNTKGDVASVKQTADSLNAYIKESRGSSTLTSILSMDPNNSTIAQVVNGQVVAAINTSSDGSVKIDGKTLHITADTKIENAVIKSAMIDSIEADKIKSGTLDASQIRVINLDANSITTGSLSAVVNDLRKFNTYTVSASSPWDFNYTKSSYGNWFLIGEPISDHVYNGPRDANHNKLTPYMYVTSRGSSDGTRFTVTVWKDNDPTQYQRVWNGSSWSDWVMLPNTKNLISAINLSPDSVKISGKKIELDGNTVVTGQLDLMQKNTNWVSQNSNYHNPWSWNNAHIYFNNYLQLFGENCTVTYEDDSHLNGGRKFYSIGTLTPGYLKFTTYQNKVKLTDEKFDGQIARTYIDSARIEANDVWAGNLRIVGHHIRASDDKFVMVSNHAGTNFDSNGSVGFQVYGGIGLGKATIYTPNLDLYIQRGNAVTARQSYNDAGKVDVHCNRVISQVANTVSSRLSVKTDITPVTYDRALAAVEGTDMYDYRYVNDDSGQHYVSGIIDDVNPEDPQYHMDDMLINKERTARIDANLVGYHHVILQELLKKIDTLEIKFKLLEQRINNGNYRNWH